MKLVSVNTGLPHEITWWGEAPRPTRSHIYDYWRGELTGRELPIGIFGENFTIDGDRGDHIQQTVEGTFT
jgi:hypothetical protein